MPQLDKKIAWEKWRDPYLFEEELSELQETLSQLNEEEDDMYQEFADELEDISESLMPSKNMKILMTNFGVMPVTEGNSVSKSFKFWTGHTNFDISDSVSKEIQSVDGVEALDIYTRYRFRIAIGKLFKDRDVMFQIQTKLTDG
tara:strand:+ start:98 stop:529 length:432 start_codon:yes stop_codon:yes gene_type:complete